MPKMINLICLALTAAASFVPMEAAAVTSVPESSLCKAAIATIMNRNPATMRTRGQGDSTLVSYTRSDGNRYTYKCKLKGNRVLWGNSDGRWRTHPADSKVFYRVGEGRVFIEDRFGDGSSTKKSYTFGQLGYSPRSELVLEIQKLLNQLGLDAGPEDGMMGGKTRAAIERFQRSESLPVDGKASKQLLDKLRAVSDG